MNWKQIKHSKILWKIQMYAGIAIAFIGICMALKSLGWPIGF